MQLWVVEFAGKGGLIHYAYQLCRALADQGIHVTLVTDVHYELESLPHSNFRLAKWLKLWDPKPDRDAGLIYRKLRRLLRAMLHLRAWVRLFQQGRRQKPDIILLGDIRFQLDLLGLMLLRHTGIPLADICHNIERFNCSGDEAGSFNTHGLSRKVYQRIYRQFDTIYVHNISNQRRLLNLFSLPSTQISVIPHGDERLFAELHDPGLSGAQIRSSLGLTSQHKVILLFGSLATYKGVDLLIDAFANITQQQPLARLLIAGSPLAGFDLSVYQQQIDTLGINQLVQIEPRYIPSDAVAGWMEMADIAVFPYRAISQSGALMVAMTFGVASIVTRTGTLPEYVSTGPAGLVVDPENCQQLTEALEQLLSDDTLRQQLGDNARQQTLSRYSWQQVAAKITAGLPPKVKDDGIVNEVVNDG